MKTCCVLAAILCAIAAAPPGVTVNSIGMAMVRIEPGSFQMGVDSVPLPKELLKGPVGVIFDRPSDAGDYDEAPVHQVVITSPYWMSVTEVTVEQYRRFRPDYRGNAHYAPYASGVSWNDAVAFTKWLSEKERKPYRLPRRRSGNTRRAPARARRFPRARRPRRRRPRTS